MEGNDLSTSYHIIAESASDNGMDEQVISVARFLKKATSKLRMSNFGSEQWNDNFY